MASAARSASRLWWGRSSLFPSSLMPSATTRTALSSQPPHTCSSAATLATAAMATLRSSAQCAASASQDPAGAGAWLSWATRSARPSHAPPSAKSRWCPRWSAPHAPRWEHVPMAFAWLAASAPAARAPWTSTATEHFLGSRSDLTWAHVAARSAGASSGSSGSGAPGGSGSGELGGFWSLGAPTPAPAGFGGMAGPVVARVREGSSSRASSLRVGGWKAARFGTSWLAGHPASQAMRRSSDATPPKAYRQPSSRLASTACSVGPQANTRTSKSTTLSSSCAEHSYAHAQPSRGAALTEVAAKAAVSADRSFGSGAEVRNDVGARRR
mmetsp:Transcript_17253/g.39775  ORF Transcript_17253/g.39775 Transcript_17253/m.39775 type:complete len:327 (-) Transcript_17253:536-1516(-)